MWHCSVLAPLLPFLWNIMVYHTWPMWTTVFWTFFLSCEDRASELLPLYLSKIPNTQSQASTQKGRLSKRTEFTGPFQSQQWLSSWWLCKPQALSTISPLAFECCLLLPICREHWSPWEGMWISSLSITMRLSTSVPIYGPLLPG